MITTPRLCLALMLALAGGVMVATDPVRAAPGQPVPVAGSSARCVEKIDVSGSGTDNLASWGWAMRTLEIVHETLQLAPGELETSTVVYGDYPRVVSPSGPSIEFAPIGETDEVVKAVLASAASSEWTDPLPALRQIASVPRLDCIIHITDGTLDLPPGRNQDVPSYLAELLALGDDLGRRGIPMLTVVLFDQNNDVWREVAERTGGAYFVDPDDITVRKEILDMISRLSPTTAPPSPAPTPSVTTTTAPPTPAVTPSATPNVPPGGIPATSSPWLLLGMSLGAAATSLAAISMLAALRRNRSRLTGTIEIHQIKEEEDVR